MKVRVSDIPAQGLVVNDTLALDALNSRLQEGSASDIVFVETPKVSLVIHRTPGGAETKGTVSTRIKQQCSRCADDVTRELEVRADFVLQPKPRHGLDTSAAGEVEEIGIIFFDGENVELEECLQENLILALERFWHPPIDKAGACTFCGKNFEAQNSPAHSDRSLGALLKKAGVS